MTTENQSFRILVADDNDLVRGSVCSILGSCAGVTICGEAADGKESLQKAIDLKPDIIVLDLSMPGLNGLEAAVFIHEQVPEAEILIVTEHDSSTLAHLPNLPGIRGYVMKSQMDRDLIPAIEAAYKHRPLPPPSKRKPRVVAA